MRKYSYIILATLLIGGCSQNEQSQEHNTNQGPKVTEVKNTNIQKPTRESGQQIASKTYAI